MRGARIINSVSFTFVSENGGDYMRQTLAAVNEHPLILRAGVP
jgi:hypothetical protein